ncbi:PadR family transcriptional regulator [Phytomonospora endophytica]|uniref:DNA-binding PadR family transcriptional regulator n=1 Tax=Phytomonospora endophytica TaxID=714109 RepID=A0A841FZ86_9ACTN|nr:PadR family transcriptional regulator [Phytomonospora endophytica]MBB6039028.1 DNA-binding PadR family transcriptional regulator [Phytomonospora endophytica]GIG69506.1 PadR family transcriptional regulator [Phytomonospora endophytica]
MAQRRKVGNILGLALLSLLVPGDALHPYEMARILRHTGKEQDMNIKVGSLYTVVQNLEKHGFIEAVTAERDGRRPERTPYKITPAGRAELTDWLGELVAVPQHEYPRFRAALSILGVLSPDDVVRLLERRLDALDAESAAQRRELDDAGDLPRVFLIEVEYTLAMREAEAAWVRGLLAAIADDSLSGVREWREFHDAGGRPPPEWKEMLDSE